MPLYSFQVVNINSFIGDALLPPKLMYCLGTNDSKLHLSFIRSIKIQNLNHRSYSEFYADDWNIMFIFC